LHILDFWNLVVGQYEYKAYGYCGGNVTISDNTEPEESEEPEGCHASGLSFLNVSAGLAVLTISLKRERKRISEPDFITKAMRECSNVASVIELAQTFDFGKSISGQLHFADSTGDAVVISAGKDGELAFTRKGKGDRYLVSTNFNLAAPESSKYPCWRYDTATEMLGELGSEQDLTIDYFRSILDAIHVEGIWVDTAVSYIFDLNSGDICLYYAHQFEDAAKMNFEGKMNEINESSQLTASVFSAPLGEGLTSHVYFFSELYSEETLEKARSEIQKYKRQYYVCIAAGAIAGMVIVSGLSLFAYKKVKDRWKKPWTTRKEEDLHSFE
jgi:hypothetical protein